MQIKRKTQRATRASHSRRRRSRSCGTRRVRRSPDPRARREPGLLAPRGTTDRRRPEGGQHGPLRVREPGQDRHRHAHRELDPVRGAQRRAELLPVRQNTHYIIHIDNNGDGVADINYIWTFKNHYRDATGQFLYNTGVVNSSRQDAELLPDLHAAASGQQGHQDDPERAIAAPSDTGKASMPNYAGLRAQATKSLPGGGKAYAGQADDPFFLDLRVFDLLYGGNLSEAGHDTLKGYNVNTLALQIPKNDLALNGSTRPQPGHRRLVDHGRAHRLHRSRERQDQAGPYVQVSRLGNPLVNEAVVPLAYKDAFNAIPPRPTTPSRRSWPGPAPDRPGADPGDLRHPGPNGPAQRPGGDLPDRCRQEGTDAGGTARRSRPTSTRRCSTRTSTRRSSSRLRSCG